MKSTVRNMAAGAVCICIAGVAVGDEAKGELQALFEDHQAWVLREFPGVARARGDYSSADKIAEVGLAATQRRHEARERFLSRLRAIERDALSENDRLSYDLFEAMLGEQIDGHRFRMILAPIEGRSGPQQTIPQMHDGVRFGSYDDFANYLTRLELVPGQVDGVLELLKLGVAEGRTPPRVSVLGVPAQFAKLLGDDESVVATGGLSALAGPFEKDNPVLSVEQRAGLRRRFDEVSLPAVRAAIRKLGTYVTNE